MTYYFIHDTNDERYPYIFITMGTLKDTGWGSEIANCFSKVPSDISYPDETIEEFLGNNIYHHTLVHLDEWSFQEFASKYPELLL